MTDADFFLPYSLDDFTVEDGILRYLAELPTTSPQFVASMQISIRKRAMHPLRDFDVRFHAVFTASFGYDRIVHYTAYEDVYEHGYKRRIAVTKQKTVTDWNPFQGTDEGRCQVLGYSGPDLSEHGKKLLLSSDIERFVAYNDSVEFGCDVIPFSLSAAQVWQESVSSRVDQIVGQSIRRHAQGDRQKDWAYRWTANYTSQSLLAPLVEVEIRSGDRKLTYFMDGADSSRIKGDAPPLYNKLIYLASGGSLSVLGPLISCGSVENFQGFQDACFALAGLAFVSCGIIAAVAHFKNKEIKKEIVRSRVSAKPVPAGRLTSS